MIFICSRRKAKSTKRKKPLFITDEKKAKGSKQFLPLPFFPILYYRLMGLKMSLTAADVKKIAHLARLGIDAQDIDAYVKDLSGILNLVEQMNAVDTATTQPLSHPLDQAQRLRPDAVTETDQHQLFQSQAPLVEAGLYLVPKVIE
jgi:aspartyl-tRNA(Asn)/glutamyl-tRNA(Gln) amidotransferase subunit C